MYVEGPSMAEVCPLSAAAYNNPRLIGDEAVAVHQDAVAHRSVVAVARLLARRAAEEMVLGVVAGTCAREEPAQ
jgi:hypothetical protein